ncbi:hypothetical protein O6H91_Y241000 [Diphasiastrum complanatum]|nr:hypothetical protein O6H91_Y241000 [Diphasiastrum complanatum]
MSLALVQDYASEEEKQIQLSSDSDSSSSGEDEAEVESESRSRMQIPQNLMQINTSSLPSPSDVFSEITGPPDYLKASATEPMPCWQLNSRQSVDNALWHSQNLKKSQAAEDSLERPTLRAGAIVEAKAQLVEVHDHVRDEAVDGVKQNGSRIPSVELPPPEDAAQLLRSRPLSDATWETAHSLRAQYPSFAIADDVT